MLVLARESVAACRGLSCCCGTAVDRTPALQRGYISLHWACSRGHPAVVQTLLEHGADVAARDDVGAAGGRACRWCRLGCVRQCLRPQRVRLCGEVACLAGTTAGRAPCVHEFPVLYDNTARERDWRARPRHAPTDSPARFSAAKPLSTTPNTAMMRSRRRRSRQRCASTEPSIR